MQFSLARLDGLTVWPCWKGSINGDKKNAPTIRNVGSLPPARLNWLYQQLCGSCQPAETQSASPSQNFLRYHLVTSCTILLLPIRHFQSVRSPPRSEQHLSLSSMLQLVHGIHLAHARDWCRFQVESNLNPFLILIHSLPPSPHAECCDILLKPCKLDFESFPRLGQPAQGMTGTDHLEFTFVRIVRQN